MALALALMSCAPLRTPVQIVDTPAMTDCVIYIIGVEEYLSIDSEAPVYVLGYTINGSYQDPPFRSKESVEEFKVHLKTLGKVIDRVE